MVETNKKKRSLKGIALPGNLWTSILAHHIKRQKKHHLVIGAGTVAAIMCAVLVLVIPGKTKKLRADVGFVVEISAPTSSAGQTPRLASLSDLPSLPSMGSFVNRDLPRAEVFVKSLVTIANHDGIP